MIFGGFLKRGFYLPQEYGDQAETIFLGGKNYADPSTQAKLHGPGRHTERKLFQTKWIAYAKHKKQELSKWKNENFSKARLEKSAG